MTTETDKIEGEINRSRTALNDTIEQLGGKLSPGQMLDEAMGLAKGQAGEFAAALGKQIKGNPLPVLLIGAGIGLMLINGQKGGQSQHHSPESGEQGRRLMAARSGVVRLADETDDAFSERMHAAEAAALSLKQHAGEAIDAFKARVAAAGHAVHQSADAMHARMDAGMDAVGKAASQAAGQLQGGASDIKHKALSFYDEYPLAVGAIGLAVGALIGASAPLSSVERENLDGVADAVARSGGRVADKGAKLVGQMTDKVVEGLH